MNINITSFLRKVLTGEVPREKSVIAVEGKPHAVCDRLQFHVNDSGRLHTVSYYRGDHLVGELGVDMQLIGAQTLNLNGAIILIPINLES